MPDAPPPCSFLSLHWCEKKWWKLCDGQRWIGVKRRSNNFLNEGWPSEKRNLVLSRESTPTKDEAPQLTRLAIPVKLRATNQFSRCTTPLLCFFPRLDKLDDGRRWMGSKRSNNNFWMRDGQVKTRISFCQESQHPHRMRHHSWCD